MRRSRRSSGIALAQYFAEQKVEAEASFAEFRRQHPSHEMLPWALYYEGMTRYSEMGTIDRDQTATRAAIDRFNLFLSRFPDHHLATLAQERLDTCRQALAEHELYIARFYFTVEDFRAAAGRAEEVLTRYPEAGLSDQALLLIGQAQVERHRFKEAADALQRLLDEHPESARTGEAESLLAKVKTLSEAGPEALGEAPDESDARDAVDSFLPAGL